MHLVTQTPSRNSLNAKAQVTIVVLALHGHFALYDGLAEL